MGAQKMSSQPLRILLAEANEKAITFWNPGFMLHLS
jgi:hypothetical protein